MSVIFGHWSLNLQALVKLSCPQASKLKSKCILSALKILVDVFSSAGRRDYEHVLPAEEGDHGVCPGPGQGGDRSHHEGGGGILYTRRIRRREKLFLALKGYGTLKYAYDRVFTTC